MKILSNVMKSGMVSGAAGIACLLAVSSASAEPIPFWGYTIETGFTAWAQVGGSSTGPVITNSGTSGPSNNWATNLSWGDGSNGGPQSYLDINSPFSGSGLFTNGLAVDSSLITHGNNPIVGPSNHLTSATISTELTLTPFGLGAGPSLPSQSTTFGIRFEETPNSSTNGELCGDTSASTDCGDVFVLLNPEDLVSSFILGDYNYTLTVMIAGLTDLTPTQCNAAGAGFAPCTGLNTDEGQLNSYASTIGITATAVPEPSTIVLFGLGLIGVGAARRKKLAA